jgi:hypothetical protein
MATTHETDGKADSKTSRQAKRERLMAACAVLTAVATRFTREARATQDDDRAAWLDTWAMQCSAKALALTQEIEHMRTWHDSPVVF